MTKPALITALFVLATFVASAQGKFYTKTGRVSFYSSTSVENIEAINKSAIALLDSKTGGIQFAVMMKGFEFKKALMQEDFNSDYIESNKYPKAEFKGQITNNSEIKYTTDGSYDARVKGKLTMHGITNDVDVTGTIVVKDGKVQVKSVFNVQIADYKITVRKIYKDNISSTIKITVESTLDALDANSH